MYKLFLLHSLLYLLVSWAWWDWHLTWLTNHCPSLLWHCWLDRLTNQIVPEMTYNISSGTLNPTIRYHLFVRLRRWFSCDCIVIWCKWHQKLTSGAMQNILAAVHWHLLTLPRYITAVCTERCSASRHWHTQVSTTVCHTCCMRSCTDSRSQNASTTNWESQCIAVCRTRPQSTWSTAIHQSQTFPADVIYDQPLDITWPYHVTDSALSVVRSPLL